MPTFYDTVFVTAAEQGCVISSSARFKRILRAVKCHRRNANGGLSSRRRSNGAKAGSPSAVPKPKR